MRRLMLLAMLPVLGGLFWAFACERDNYRDVLPLRPLDGEPDMSVVLDLTHPPDQRPVPMPDLAVPPDLTAPPDLSTPPDLAATDM